MFVLILATVLERIVFNATSLFIAYDPGNRIIIYVNLLTPYVFLSILAYYSFDRYRLLFMVKNRFDSHLVVILLLCICYFSLWLFFGILLGQGINDIVGSTLRALAPFLTMLVTIQFLSRFAFCELKVFLRQFIIILLLSDICGALIKYSLIQSGVFYGGGLNQYSVNVVILSWLIFFVFYRYATVFSRVGYAILLLVLIILSLLSLKRTVFVSLGFSLFFILFFGLQIRISTKLIVCGLLLSLLYLLLFNTPIGVLIIDRIQYTFYGDGIGVESFDPSTSTRIAEINAAIYTLNNTFFGWITGLGPGAGYLNPDAFDFYNLNSMGEPYHIHSGFFIILFRYGLIGLLLHCYFVLANIKLIFYFRRTLKEMCPTSAFDPRIIGFSSSLLGLINLLSLFSGNVFFGDFSFAMCFVIAFYSRILWMHDRHG